MSNLFCFCLFCSADDPLSNSLSLGQGGAHAHDSDGDGDLSQDEVIDYDQEDDKMLQMALQDYLRRIDTDENSENRS